MIRVAGLLAVLLAPSITIAGETCPWLNAATAEGILGTPVELNVTHESASTTCVFSAQSKAAKMSLRIEVVAAAKTGRPECGSAPLPLRAIGNEAHACSVTSAANQVVEAVFGRVRDQHFQIEVTTDDRHLSRDKLREKARMAALHVAGNLF
jgi:hypothetical protein